MQVAVSRKSLHKDHHFDLGQTQPSHSCQLNPQEGLLPPSHTCQKSDFSDLCLNRSHSDPPEPDVVYYKTKEVSLETSVRCACKGCYKNPVSMVPCDVTDFTHPYPGPKLHRDQELDPSPLSPDLSPEG